MFQPNIHQWLQHCPVHTPPQFLLVTPAWQPTSQPSIRKSDHTDVRTTLCQPGTTGLTLSDKTTSTNCMMSIKYWNHWCSYHMHKNHEVCYVSQTEMAQDCLQCMPVLMWYASAHRIWLGVFSYRSSAHVVNAHLLTFALKLRVIYTVESKCSMIVLVSKLDFSSREGYHIALHIYA